MIFKYIKIKTAVNLTLAYIGLFFVLDLLSYAALVHPVLNQVIFIALTLICLGLSMYRLEYGLLMVLGELFIGSMGHLFVLHMGSYDLPIRMALWLAVMIIFNFKFIIQVIKDKGKGDYLKSFKAFSALKYFLLLALFAIIGLANAYLKGRGWGLVFNDFNAWLYWLLLFPAVAIFSQGTKNTIDNLKRLFMAAAIWLSLKTLALLFIFTHELSFAPEIYIWLRRTLSGEMTATLSGWPRVFIQAQIYSGVALFLIFWSSLKEQASRNKENIINLFLTALFFSTLLISFSRSFWLALTAALVVSIRAAWRFYSFRRALIAGAWLISSFILGFAFIYSTVIFPYPAPGKFNADFIDRLNNSGEAAVASRWSLLPVLSGEIKKEPLLGQGFGATVTYISSDPRVLQNNPSGLYTTYAFEWGYLDLWLKIGLFGLVAYLILIIYLMAKAIKYGLKSDNGILIGIGMGIMFLAFTNAFTPYLNHPLGIGILIISSCLIAKDRVY